MKTLILNLVLVLAITGTQGGMSFFNGNKNFETLPNHKNYTLMARFIVHNADWAGVAYKSTDKDTPNLSMSTIFSYGDGPKSNGTGVPYFFLTDLEPAVVDMMKDNNRCGLMMSLVQTDICAKNKWDAEDPRCARVFLSGKLRKLANNTAEYEFAKKTFADRHPLFVGMPGFHRFFYVRYDIETVKLISGVGGVRIVKLDDYYRVKDSKFNLDAVDPQATF